MYATGLYQYPRRTLSHLGYHTARQYCYEPDSLWPTPHEPLNTNPLIESLAECARADADADVHGWCSQCVHAEIRLFTKYGHQHEQN